VAGALLRYAPLPGVVAGLGVAAFINWMRIRGAANKIDNVQTKRR